MVYTVQEEACVNHQVLTFNQPYSQANWQYNGLNLKLKMREKERMDRVRDRKRVKVKEVRVRDVRMAER